MLKLTVLSGPDAGRMFTPTSAAIIIGRGNDCDVVLHDSTVSRRHCMIQREGRKFVVSDLHTANGLFLNNPKTRIDTHTLSQGDEIIFGRSRLRVELPAPLEEALAVRIANDRPSPQSSRGGEASQLSDPAQMSLPSNWQEGMTVVGLRPKIPLASERPLAAIEQADYERDGILARIIAGAKRRVIALKNSLLSRPVL